MSGQDNGGPAFPGALAYDHINCTVYTSEDLDAAGMSLRDYFASKALTALIADGIQQHAIADAAAKNGISVHKATARMAYHIADIMIAERAK